MNKFVHDNAGDYPILVAWLKKEEVALQEKEEVVLENVVKHVRDNAGEYPVLVAWLDREKNKA